MRGLIAALRNRADACFSKTTGSAPLDYAAADEIERLDARCLKLYNANVKQYERIAELEANNKVAFIDGQMNAEINLAGRIAELEAEVKALWLEKIERDNVADREWDEDAMIPNIMIFTGE